MRVGLFGGTFNPIHNGHLQVAKELKDGFPLDKIIFIPSAIPPHKETEDVASAQDRLRMLDIAISANPVFAESFSISDIELQRSGPSYTIDTVSEYLLQSTDKKQSYLIMGMDAFFEIDTWKSYHDLFQIIPFIIMSRPGKIQNAATGNEKTLEAFIQSHISSSYRYFPMEKICKHPDKKPVYYFHVTPIDISATNIRLLIKKGTPIQSMLPPGVMDYIKLKGLYT